jgi:hypothetical protein
MKDFYMILPSNSNPLTHPNNDASNFIIELEKPLNLTGKWVVALTEMIYSHSQISIREKAYNYQGPRPLIYIYTNIIESYQTGHVRTPLLRNAVIKYVKHYNYKLNEPCRIAFEHPIYLPVSCSSINRIEINIRHDDGQFVHYSEGSKTILTLHFNKVE